ncbi:MAG TPA: hypothetical protein DEA55_09560 [Rhodospirillaceae bacterium]|nr:hypothetical protein [Rhodospirillaceae bacterium]
MLAKSLLASIANSPIWPAADLIVKSWVPFFPDEMPRIAPRFYLSSSGIRKTALQIVAKHKRFVAGSAFDEICAVAEDFFQKKLWPKDYKKILSVAGRIDKAYSTEEDLRTVESQFDEFIEHTFAESLYMAPIIYDNPDGQTMPPSVDLSDKNSAWISSEDQLKKFVEGRFMVLCDPDLSKFPPERRGLQTFENNGDLSLTWLVALSRNEETAISSLTTLLGAICIAMGPHGWPNSSESNFNGVAELSQSQYGFGSFHRVQFPVIHGTLDVTEERTSRELIIRYNARFELDVVAKVSALGDLEFEQRIKRAVYFLGLGFRSEEIARYMFCASALDALFCFDRMSLTETAKDGLKVFSGDKDSIKKIEMLLAIRGRIAHGKRSTPQEASDYVGYWRRFDQEPLDGFWCLIRQSIVNILSDVEVYKAELSKIEGSKKPAAETA